jgi:ribosomal protein S18 acetylase RimI-like enzyme
MERKVFSMIIDRLAPADFSAACELFNRYAEVEFPHRKLSLPQFTEQFLQSTDVAEKVNLAAKEGDSLVGFASGCVKHGSGIGYITFLLVDPSVRRKGLAREMLAVLEKELAAVEDIEKYQIYFFNPVALTWIVPGTDGHDHPNAPGIDVASDAYIFFKNMGYLDVVYQNSFYLPLENYTLPADIQKRIDGLAEHDLSICFYDKAKHYGLEELFDDLGNEGWREEIIGMVNRPDGGDPVLIAEHNGKAVGFTGPIRAQESGRGYFAGIGVHSEYRKYGLGKALFSMLCKCEKETGARYMTLFTGETNPARYIYTSAGFKIVKTWSDMEKIIKK